MGRPNGMFDRQQDCGNISRCMKSLANINVKRLTKTQRLATTVLSPRAITVATNSRHCRPCTPHHAPPLHRRTKLRGNYQRESLGPSRTTQSELGSPGGRSESQASQFQANTVSGKPATALLFRTAAHSEPPQNRSRTMAVKPFLALTQSASRRTFSTGW